MKVSLIIPIYNGEDFLKGCIESILAQTYRNIEIILVNDGSTDNSGKICEYYSKLDNRIKVIHKENGGQSEARNFGIDISSGDLISFIDCDDEVSEEYVSFLKDNLDKYDADISVSSFTYITPKREIVHATGEVSLLSNDQALRRMLMNDGFDMGPWAKLYKKELFENIRFPVGKLFEDSYTTYQIFAEAKKVIFVSKSIYHYIHRSNSTVNGQFNEKKMDLIEMNEKNAEFIKQNFPHLTLEAHRRVVWSYFSSLNQIMSSDDKKVIEKYSPKVVHFILEQDSFFRENKFLSLRDKLAFYSLKYFGLNIYYLIWKMYLKIVK